MAAWRAVEQTLANLHFVLEREPANKLARSIAEARAAVEGFAASARRFPRDHLARVQAAERGLQYLAIAADGARRSRNWEAMSAYPDVIQLLPRGCDGDHLAFSPMLISEAFTVSGSHLILEATNGGGEQQGKNWQPGFHPSLDVAKETAACRRQNQALLRLATDSKAAAVAQHTRWKYNVEISNPTGCLMTPYSDDQPIPVPLAQVHHFQLEANESARLEKVFCKAANPADAITVTMNGQRYDPVWLLDDSGVNYVTQLAPPGPASVSVGGSR